MDAAKCAIPQEQSRLVESNLFATCYKLSRYETAMERGPQRPAQTLQHLYAARHAKAEVTPSMALYGIGLGGSGASGESTIENGFVW